MLKYDRTCVAIEIPIQLTYIQQIHFIKLHGVTEHTDNSSTGCSY